jgi:nicotinamide riboside transporter PnuC
MIEVNWIGELFDTISLCSGKVGSWFNARGKRICFLIWIGCVSYWFFIDLHRNLYAQACSCFISLALHIYGYINWGKKGIK